MKKNDSAILLSLTVLAFFIRLIVLNFTIDVPGDGPTRATIAYIWSISPKFIDHGTWPPGFTYVVGTLSFFLKNPLYSARIFNLLIGTLTVPFFYILVRKVFSYSTSLFSTLLLVILPLHIGISASSLTEISALFAIVAAMVTLIIASEKTKWQILYLGLSILFLCWGEMIRYEIWLIVPLFPIYFFLKTRRPLFTIIMILLLLVFPTFWSIGNHLYYGDFLQGLSEGVRGSEAVGQKSVNLINASKIIAKKSLAHLGIILFISLVIGVILQLYQIVKGKSNIEKLFYISVVFINWSVIFYFAIKRGLSLYDRYLLFSFVMSLPLVILPTTTYFRNNFKRLFIYIVAAIICIGISIRYYDPQIYITYRQPTEIKNLVDWLRRSPYDDEPILSTKMGWNSTYLPQYYPEVASRYLIVSFWASDSQLQKFLNTQNQFLLITCDSDQDLQVRIENFLKKNINANELIHTEGSIKVYRIKTD
jgi:4-amino-4-deoxy-L-arabinose transferase-like glycosyltransferase